MSDRELLELAAKVVGVVGEWDSEYIGVRVDCPPVNGICVIWNPLTDDGDALRLAVKLGFSIGTSAPATGIGDHYIEGFDDVVAHNGDPYAATRRAIVRAAAEIGRTL